MHTIKLDIPDSIYNKVISALKKFDKEVVITEETNECGGEWEKLSAEEQEELLISIEESKDEANLISNEEVMKKLEKWL